MKIGMLNLKKNKKEYIYKSIQSLDIIDDDNDYDETPNKYNRLVS